MQMNLNVISMQIENLQQQKMDLRKLQSDLEHLIASFHPEQEQYTSVVGTLHRKSEEIDRQCRLIEQMQQTLKAVKNCVETTEKRICDQYMGNRHYYISPKIKLINFGMIHIPKYIKILC